MLAFLVGASHWARFDVIGQIYLSELALAGLLPFLLMSRGRELWSRTCRTFLGLAGLWLVGQVATDIIRETDFRDYARGWANIAFFVVNFCALYLLLHGSRRRFVLFALGLAIGGFLSYWLTPGLYAAEYPWKFGLGNGTALLAILVALWRPLGRVPILALAPLLAVSAYSLLMGFRSMFAFGLLTSLYVLAQRWLARRPSAAPSTLASRSTATFLVGALLAGLATLEAYDYAAREGYLDERSLGIYERQSQGELGILPGGRLALFAAIPAIFDSPIVGHGSKAKNPEYVSRILDARLYGYEASLMPSWDTGLIPSHSMLFGAWVEAGLLGAFFWAWVALLTFGALAHLLRAQEPLSPLIAYAGISQLWHILFSPFGGDMRLTTAFAVVLVIVTWKVHRAGTSRRPVPTGTQDGAPPRSRVRGSRE